MERQLVQIDQFFRRAHSKNQTQTISPLAKEFSDTQSLFYDERSLAGSVMSNKFSVSQQPKVDVEKILRLIDKYSLKPQKFNRVRYEIFKEDPEETGFMKLSKFKVVYSRLGIKTGITDEKILLEFLEWKEDRSVVDFRKLNRLVEVLALRHLKQLEGKKSSGPFAQNNSYKEQPMAGQDVEEFGEKVQGKLRRAFMSSSQAFRFLDLAQTGRVGFAAFLFSIGFFNLEFSLLDAQHLFRRFCPSNQAYLDHQAVARLFGQRKETRHTMVQDLRSLVSRKYPRHPVYSKDMNKTALAVEDMLEYPHFFKQKKAKLANARKLQIRSKNHSQQQCYEKQSLEGRGFGRVESVTQKATGRSQRSKLGPMGYDVHATGGDMGAILSHTYMNNFVQMLKGKDVQNYIDNKLKNQKPIFKNFIENNANIRRKQVQIKRMRDFQEKEQIEEEIQARK